MDSRPFTAAAAPPIPGDITRLDDDEVSPQSSQFCSNDNLSTQADTISTSSNHAVVKDRCTSSKAAFVKLPVEVVEL